jgi:diguanylate cyclase (GGDEF)-like protein
MLPAPIPPNEAERLASLQKMRLLDLPDEVVFDRITRTAQRLFQVPIALISLIDENRQWFKSCVGLPVRETPRDVSFCGHAIMEPKLFVVENALGDSRFADNPLVTGDPRVIFYAGVPLRNTAGMAVGTLCLIDHQPRVFTAWERQSLRDLGYWVEQVFVTRELSESQQALLAGFDAAQRNNMLDPLLNIWKREAIEDVLEREAMRAYHQHTPLALMRIDVLDVAAVTAEFGPALADALRLEVAKALASVIRTYDTLGRFGDDGFLAVLPNASEEKSRLIADRARHAAELIVVKNGQNLIEASICVSVVAADYVTSTPAAGELLQQAEAALQAGKAAPAGE